MKLIFKDTSHNKRWCGHWTGHIYCHGATLAEQVEIDFSDGVPDFATAGSSGTDVQHSYAFGDYVIADYEGESFPGRIAKVLDSENITLKVELQGSIWKWPNREDICDYHFSNILQTIGEPRLLSGAGINKYSFLCP